MFITEFVSLIAAFSTERALGRIEKGQDFLKWLAATNHEELRGILERNGQAVAGVESLLNENQETLMAKFENIDGILAKLLSHMEGFGAVVTAINPGAALSEQAISILRQFNEKRAARCLEVETNDSLGYIFLDRANGEIEHDDEQFIRDDFATLVDIGFMRQEFNSKGSPIYVITRPGSQYVKLLSPQAPA